MKLAESGRSTLEHSILFAEQLSNWANQQTPRPVCRWRDSSMSTCYLYCLFVMCMAFLYSVVSDLFFNIYLSWSCVIIWVYLVSLLSVLSQRQRNAISNFNKNHSAMACCQTAMFTKIPYWNKCKQFRRENWNIVEWYLMKNWGKQISLKAKLFIINSEMKNPNDILRRNKRTKPWLSVSKLR